MKCPSIAGPSRDCPRTILTIKADRTAYVATFIGVDLPSVQGSIAMRRLLVLWIMVGLCLACGCAYTDLFSVFGDGYTGGGTRSDKQQQYNADVSSYGS